MVAESDCDVVLRRLITGLFVRLLQVLEGEYTLGDYLGSGVSHFSALRTKEWLVGGPRQTPQQL